MTHQLIKKEKKKIVQIVSSPRNDVDPRPKAQRKKLVVSSSISLVPLATRGLSRSPSAAARPPCSRHLPALLRGLASRASRSPAAVAAARPPFLRRRSVCPRHLRHGRSLAPSPSFYARRPPQAHNARPRRWESSPTATSCARLYRHNARPHRTHSVSCVVYSCLVGSD